MNLPTHRLALVLFWIVSLGGAFWTGGEWKQEAGRAEAETPPVALTFLPKATESGGEKGGFSSEDVVAEGVGRETREIIAKARREMGPGSGAVFNPQMMHRTMSPLMDLPASEIGAALAEIASTVADTRQRIILESLLLSRWAEEDPQSALAYAEKRADEGGSAAENALTTVVGAWANRDPDAAWEWYVKQKDSDSLPLGIGGFGGPVMAIFSATAKRDLETAIKRIGQLDNENSRQTALSGIGMAASDPDTRKAILDRTATLDPESRRVIRQTVLRQWASGEPAATMAWLRALPAEERGPLTGTVASSLVAANPEKGATFLLEEADEENLSQRYSTIVNAWAYRDPVAAGEWLNRQPKSPAQDRARSSFANQVMRVDAAAAMEWAKSISTDSGRGNSVRRVYQQWHTRDEVAADAALESSGLPAAKIEQIRQETRK